MYIFLCCFENFTNVINCIDFTLTNTITVKYFKHFLYLVVESVFWVFPLDVSYLIRYEIFNSCTTYRISPIITLYTCISLNLIYKLLINKCFMYNFSCFNWYFFNELNVDKYILLAKSAFPTKGEDENYINYFPCFTFSYTVTDAWNTFVLILHFVHNLHEIIISECI